MGPLSFLAFFMYETIIIRVPWRKRSPRIFPLLPAYIGGEALILVAVLGHSEFTSGFPGPPVF